MSGRRGNVKVDYWTPENTGAKYPKPGGLTLGDNPKYGSTLGYFDASYLKIRTISLGYTFNQKFITNSGIGNLRLYVTAQNPFVIVLALPQRNRYGPRNQLIWRRKCGSNQYLQGTSADYWH